MIAIVAATAALWAAVTVRGFLTSLGASLVMGIAVSGMHYTGMAAVSVHLHSTTGTSWAGDSPSSLLLPMLLGPLVFLVLAGVVVMFDPLLVLGEGERSRSGTARPPRPAPGTSGQRPGREPEFRSTAGTPRPNRESYARKW